MEDGAADDEETPLTDEGLHQLATQTAIRGLARVRHLVGVIGAHPDALALLNARLASDQLCCTDQLRMANGFALRCVMPVLLRPWALANEGGTVEDLQAQVKQAARDIAAVTVADFEGAASRSIQHRAGDALIRQSASDYLIQFAIPNQWFHLTTAFAILRAQGVEIGKADFDGLHQYPQGFAFT